MNLQEWRQRKSAGEEATLPSGLEIRVRRVSLPDLAAQGKIPQTLQPKIDELTSQAKAGQTPSISRLGDMTGVLDVVCRACIVGPDGLDVSELDFTDKMSIFEWANEVGRGLQTFRQEPGEPVGAGRTGEAIRAEAVVNPGVE